jgi:hypothetical protein
LPFFVHFVVFVVHLFVHFVIFVVYLFVLFVVFVVHLFVLFVVAASPRCAPAVRRINPANRGIPLASGSLRGIIATAW